jgi:hypothetical protein
MNIYKSFYDSLCNRGKNLGEQWKPGSGLHRHHIIPKHNGGLDDKNNYTYLTIREHIVAHWLLWKIHKKYQDKCAFSILRGNPKYEEKIIAIDGISYSSIRDACNKLNKSYRTIQRWALDGKSKTYNNNRKGAKNNGIKIVIDGIEYKSKKEAARILHVTEYFINKNCCIIVY